MHANHMEFYHDHLKCNDNKVKVAMFALAKIVKKHTTQVPQCLSLINFFKFDDFTDVKENFDGSFPMKIVLLSSRIQLYFIFNFIFNLMIFQNIDRYLHSPSSTTSFRLQANSGICTSSFEDITLAVQQALSISNHSNACIPC